MKEKIIAKKYAVALFEVIEAKSLTSTSEDLKSIKDVITSELSFFEQPNISQENKKNVVKNISEMFSKELGNLLLLLIDNKRISLLPEISLIFTNLVNDYLKASEFEVISALDISDTEKSSISESIKNNVNTNAIIDFKVNPKLIIGYQVRCADKVLDFSANRILEDVKKILIK